MLHLRCLLLGMYTYIRIVNRNIIHSILRSDYNTCVLNYENHGANALSQHGNVVPIDLIMKLLRTASREVTGHRLH
jgi:hypothetical protein